MPSAVPKWLSTPVPSTPVQLNRYLDACTEHILSYVHSESLPIDTHDVSSGGDSDKSYGITADDAVSHRTFRCSLCECTTQRLVVANPFTNAHMMAICSECSENQKQEL